MEEAYAVFVTSNTGFARAAWEYGQKYESSHEVSSVITDFSLANTAWLKAPMEAPNLPLAQLHSFSYAALQPSNELLSKFMQEVEKLENEGSIDERAVQVLRSDNPLVYSELMDMTLGENEYLTGATPKEVFERVSDHIRKEEAQKLTSEQMAHEATQEELETERTRSRKMIDNIYKKSYSRAKVEALAVSMTFGLLLVVGLLRELVDLSNSFLVWLFGAGLLVLLLLTAGNLVLGTNVLNIHSWLLNKRLELHLKNDAKTLGIDVESILSSRE